MATLPAATLAVALRLMVAGAANDVPALGDTRVTMGGWPPPTVTRTAVDVVLLPCMSMAFAVSDCTPAVGLGQDVV